MPAKVKMKCRPTIKQETATGMQKGGNRAKHYQH